MQNIAFPVFSVSEGKSVNVASGAASASVAIPTTAGGAAPRFIRIAATVAARVRIGTGAGTTAVAADMLVQPGLAVFVKTNGRTHVAAIQDAAAGVVNVVALED